MLCPFTFEMTAVDAEHLSHETTLVRVPGAELVPGARYSVTVDLIENPADVPSDA